MGRGQEMRSGISMKVDAYVRFVRGRWLEYEKTHSVGVAHQ